MLSTRDDSAVFKSATVGRKRNFSVTSLFSSNNSINKQKMKKKLISREMISGPLGDVRHTAHVGSSDGDVFGDTTFLHKEIATQGGSRSSTGGSSDSSINNQSEVQQVDGNIATLRKNGKHVDKKPKHKREKMFSSVDSLSAISSDPPAQQPKEVMTSQSKPQPNVTSQNYRLSIYEGWKTPDLGNESLLEDILKIINHK